MAKKTGSSRADGYKGKMRQGAGTGGGGRKSVFGDGTVDEGARKKASEAFGPPKTSSRSKGKGGVRRS